MTWPVAAVIAVLLVCACILASLRLVLEHSASKRSRSAERTAEEARLVAKECAEAIVKVDAKIGEIQMARSFQRKAAG